MRQPSNGYCTFHAPVYDYQMVVGSLYIPVLTGKEPCRFYRVMQRLILGIRWERIGK